MSSFTRPLTTPIFNRPPIHNGNKGDFPYPDAYERNLERQRVYNKTYYRRNRKKILAKKRKNNVKS